MDGIKLTGFADEIASNFEEQCMGLSKLEMHLITLRSINGKNILDFTYEEFKRHVLPILLRYQIKVASVGSPLGKVDVDDLFAQNEQIHKLDELIQIMNLLEVKHLRIFSLFVKDHESQTFNTVISFLKRVMEKLQPYGIIAMHENEKDIYGDKSGFCLQIFQELAHPLFKLAFDPANFVQVGEDAVICFHMLKDAVVDMHMKDALYKSKENVLIGTGDGKLRELIHLCQMMDYQGLYTLEPHLYAFNYLKELESTMTINQEYSTGFDAFLATKEAFFQLFLNNL